MTAFSKHFELKVKLQATGCTAYVAKPDRWVARTSSQQQKKFRARHKRSGINLASNLPERTDTEFELVSCVQERSWWWRLVFETKKKNGSMYAICYNIILCYFLLHYSSKICLYIRFILYFVLFCCIVYQPTRKHTRLHQSITI